MLLRRQENIEEVLKNVFINRKWWNGQSECQGVSFQKINNKFKTNRTNK